MMEKNQADPAVASGSPAALEVEDGAESPLRRCILSGEKGPREAMLRFVVGPDGSVVPDVDAVLPGHGLWMRADAATLATAIARRAFDRAARRKVTVPDGLSARIEAQLARRCMDAIGLARRSGLAVAGFEKVAAGLRAGRLSLLLAASDGAADGRRKLAAIAGGAAIANALSAAELGLPFGREHVVHAGIGPGRLARRLLADCERLGRFRGMWNDQRRT